MHEIKSFKIFQTALVIAAVYTITFAIFSVPVGLVMLVLGRPKVASEGITLPILYGVLTFIAIAFLCWLYNQVARRIGGIAFDLAPRSEN